MSISFQNSLVKNKKVQGVLALLDTGAKRVQDTSECWFSITALRHLTQNDAFQFCFYVSVLFYIPVSGEVKMTFFYTG